MLALTRKYYPASIRQRIEWNLYLESGKTLACNIPHIAKLKHPNLALIQEAFRRLLERHESLRTTFVQVDGELRQVVHPMDTIETPIEIIASKHPYKQWIEAKKEIVKTITTAIDLEKGPLALLKLYYLGQGTYRLLFMIHHIISDAVSLQILESEFLSIYQALLRGEEPKLAPMSYQLKEYAQWEQSFLQSRKGKKNEMYWTRELSGDFEPFTIARSNLKKDSFVRWRTEDGGKTFKVVFRPELTQQFHQMMMERRVPKLCILFSALFLFFHYLSHQTTLIIAAQISLRDRKQLKQLIGYLTTGIYLKVQIDQSLSIGEFIQRVRGKYLDALDHKLYSLDQLGHSIDPVCSAVLNEHPLSPEYSGFIRNFRSRPTSSKLIPYYPFDISVKEFQNGMEMEFAYKKVLLHGLHTSHFFGIFHRIVQLMLEDSSQSIEQLLHSLD